MEMSLILVVWNLRSIRRCHSFHRYHLVNFHTLRCQLHLQKEKGNKQCLTSVFRNPYQNDDKFPFYVKAGFHVAILLHRNVNTSSILFTAINL